MDKISRDVPENRHSVYRAEVDIDDHSHSAEEGRVSPQRKSREPQVLCDDVRSLNEGKAATTMSRYYPTEDFAAAKSSPTVECSGEPREETAAEWEEVSLPTVSSGAVGQSAVETHFDGTWAARSSTDAVVHCADMGDKSGHVSAYDDDTEDEVPVALDMHSAALQDKAKSSGDDLVESRDEGCGDTDMETKVADDDDDTDVEYYERSYKGNAPEAQHTTHIVRRPARQQKRKEEHSCPVCLENFARVCDLQQHLSGDNCQSFDGDCLTCDRCSLTCATVQELKVHVLGHLGKKVLSCAACGTTFPTQRLLDRHMLVDASILNKLRHSQEEVTLPELLCRTVLDILAESVNLSPSAITRKRPRSASQLGNDGQEQVVSAKKMKGKESAVKEVVYENDVDEDDDDVEEEEDLDESNLPSEVEEDLGEAEGSEIEDLGSEDGQETGIISQPFISSSLTDAPRTPSPPEFDDSMTSQSPYSAEDAEDATAPSSSSRRKSKHPLQIQRTAPSSANNGAVDQVKIKMEPEEDCGLVITEQSSAVLTSLTCPMCGELQSDKQKLDLHIAEHEKLFPYFCALCDANFMEGHLLESHVEICHLDDLLSCRNQSLQCRMCGMYFKLRDALATHLQSCRQAPSCVVCGDTFSTGPLLQKHYYSHSLEERASAEFLSCNDCGEVFVSTIQLRQHQKSHGTSRPYSCHECGDTFRQKKVLDRHRQVHTRPQDCKCEICGVQLLTRSGYIAHLRGHKNNENMEAQLAEQLLVLLKETSKRRQSKKGQRERGKEGGEEEEEDKKGLTLDTIQYLKLVDDRLTPQEMTPIKKTKRDVDFFKTRTHSCPFCELTFTGADAFQEHVGSVHKDQAHFDECDVCHQKFYGKEYLQRHRTSHGKVFAETYPCDQCSKVFRRKFSLETHRKVHSFKKFLPCDICGEEFRFINEVEKHKYREHKYDRIQTLFECNLCKVKFGTLSHLNVHCRHTHKPEEGKPFKCAKCLIVFATCTELKQHIFGSHEAGPCSGQPIKEEPCDSYEESLAGGDDRSDPLYGEVKAYVKKFVRNLPHSAASKRKGGGGTVKTEGGGEGEETGVEAYNRLTKKKMSHSTMVKRFVCETCHKCFATKSDLRTHIRTHTGETPYKCDYCDRAFKQRGHRKLHIQVAHTKIMPYTCELCNQGYPTRYRYQIHLKRHSGIKEHKCQYCDRAYYTVGKLNEHKRKHHREELAEEQAEQDGE